MREQALRSWLLGFVFWAGIGIGCLGILMTQYLTGGAWGVISRRILEAGTRTLPILVLLFIPLALGVYFRDVLYLDAPAADRAYDGPARYIHDAVGMDITIVDLFCFIRVHDVVS